MNAIRTSLAVTAVLCLVSCDAYVEKSAYAALNDKYGALNKELQQTKENLNKMQQSLNECQAHKYQIFHYGFRTWRFDSVSGTSCIMLTTKDDWKKQETMRQSCDCTDLFAGGNVPDEGLRKISCGW